MARTAPIPNFPAIPGMNPGLFLMGGGGDGGGSGAGRGKGKAGKQHGKGKNGGKDAKGGGKNAGACGAGTGAACPNPQHGNRGTSAGDPVDPVTGRVYTTAAVDLALPGLVPLVIARSYSSQRIDMDIGLGHGWSHSFAWILEERRRSVLVHSPDASSIHAERPELEGSAVLPCGRLRRFDFGYTIDSDGLTRVFAERREGGYLLSRVFDRYGNVIQLVYEDGALREIIDSVGRSIRVRRHPDGHIAAFEVKNAAAQGRWTSFATYEYDERGDLVSVADAEGHEHRFEYDEDHLLVRRREPGGLTAEFRYEDGRCVESWCTRPDQDGLDRDSPPLLADGVTKARGFLHVRVTYGVDFTEVVTSRSVRRIEGNDLDQPDKAVFAGGVHSYVYDTAGNLTGYVDAAMNEWSAERDDLGNLLRTVDPLGGTTEYQHDDRGSVIEMRDALGAVTRYERNAAGEVERVTDDLGPVVEFRHDARGLLVAATLPNGGITRMSYDDMGNRTEVVEPDGATRRIRYDFLGRITSFVDERGGETSFTYDDCGRVVAIRGPGGGVRRIRHDADGNRSQVTDEDGRTITMRWGGNGVVTEVIREDGAAVRYRYDRELDLVRVVNEAGEEHRIERDAEGRVVAETTFDGREVRYKHDALGRIVRVKQGPRTIDMAYDAVGRLVERSFSDGRKEVFEHDAVGRLVRLERDGAEVMFHYDSRGRIVREEVTRGAERHVTEYQLDAMGDATRVAGPAGTIELERDLRGRPTALSYGDVAPLRMAYDPGGFEVLRALPGGGRMFFERSADKLLTRCSVLDAQMGRAARPGEPSWVGADVPGETFRHVLDWSAGGRVREEILPDGLRVELLRDPRGRVLERRSARRAFQAVGYGPTGDLHDPAEPRAYDPGGRPVAAGPFRYRYDELGRVIEKRRADAEDAQAWTFTWTDDDLLVEARTPSGEEVRFAYDPLGRRLEKRVFSRGAVAHVTRYVWQEDALVKEIHERAAEGGDPVVEERTFVVAPGSLVPFAHREIRRGEAGTFAHYVTDFGGTPEALVRGDGTVLARVSVPDVGRADAPATPLRKPGQYEDEETGLRYNRHRYHDPDTGCFLTPEPLGLMASLKTYSYADFLGPEAIDSNGLVVESVIYGRPGPDGTRPVLGRGESGGAASSLHPAVAASLPPTDMAGRTDQNGNPVDSRGRCAEPHALSNHLDNYEWNGIPPNQRWTPPPPPPRSCRPGDPSWRSNLRGALGQIDPNDGIASGQRIGQPNERRWPACENCSQMVPRLYTLANMNPPRNVIAVGKTKAMTGRMFQPDPPLTNNPANRVYNGNPPPGAPRSMGTWSHDPVGGWTRVR